jgi:ketosteroid isomerase-like protein
MNLAMTRKPVPAVMLAVAIAILATVTAPATQAAAPGIAANAKVLVRLDDDWSSAAATKDADKVVAFYAEDAIVYPPNEPVAVGREAAKRVWASYFAAPKFTISWQTVSAEISKSGDLGFTAGTYVDSFDGPDGKPVHETGKYVCVWKKQKDGTWKATHDTWNSDAK